MIQYSLKCLLNKNKFMNSNKSFYNNYYDYDDSYYDYDDYNIYKSDELKKYYIDFIVNSIIKLSKIPPDTKILYPDFKILNSDDYVVRMNYIIDYLNYLEKHFLIKIEFIDKCRKLSERV